MTNPLRLAFMGTPDFAAVALQALINSPHDIACVYSQPPRPKGRGQQIQKSPVQQMAENHDLQVRTPIHFKDEHDITAFDALNLDIAIVAAYGLILPEAILKAPQHGCLNIHASLLPRWRGAAPIQRAILEGDTQTGITIMQMDKGLDTGDMITQQSTAITNQTTASSLHDTLADIGATLTLTILEKISEEKEIEKQPQDDSISTYAKMLNKEEGKIDWSHSAAAIGRQIRALTPWPGTWCQTKEGNRLKIHHAILSDLSSDKAAGSILDQNGHIVCGDGKTLQLITIQPENKKPMDITAAINGGYLKTGESLS